MEDTLHWLDVEDIAEELNAAHADIDPISLRFTRLRELVEALPDFKEQEGHPCNERILEEIQAHWITERQGGGAAGDDDNNEDG